MLPPAHMGSSAHGQQACSLEHAGPSPQSSSVTHATLTCYSPSSPPPLPSSPHLLPSPPLPAHRYSRSAFLVSLFYTVAVHWTLSCSRQAAYGAIASAMVCTTPCCHLLSPALTCSHLLAPATTAASAKLLLR
ncbi:unnamed protein product [Closterium sp. NIES-53]